MPVKADVVRRKLLQIDQAVGRLRSWMPITEERLQTDLVLQWAVERGMQVAAEALFDLGNHILAAEYGESVDEYGQIVERLAACEVVTSETARRLRSLAGFRNVLVHEYAEIDLARVIAALARLDDLDAFVADVERWLEARPR